MLDRLLSMNFSPFEGLYDMVVPKDHLLRKINDLDFPCRATSSASSQTLAP
ncbi:hypothetical protein [Halobacillus andaensis]|uniref:hypothetical protein n=1 Tax=Halobacillus andaensis TaxID=1176239 RepID=UPI003D73C7FA